MKRSRLSIDVFDSELFDRSIWTLEYAESRNSAASMFCLICSKGYWVTARWVGNQVYSGLFKGLDTRPMIRGNRITWVLRIFRDRFGTVSNLFLEYVGGRLSLSWISFRIIAEPMRTLNYQVHRNVNVSPRLLCVDYFGTRNPNTLNSIDQLLHLDILIFSLASCE
jgi:hypothetical protein